MYNMQSKTPTCVGECTHVRVWCTLRRVWKDASEPASPRGHLGVDGPKGEKHEEKHKYCCFFIFLDSEQICTCSLIGRSKHLGNVETHWHLGSQKRLPSLLLGWEEPRKLHREAALTLVLLSCVGLQCGRTLMKAKGALWGGRCRVWCFWYVPQRGLDILNLLLVPLLPQLVPFLSSFSLLLWFLCSHSGSWDPSPRKIESQRDR